jgi:hypothetical protein
MKYTIVMALFISCAITLALGVRAQDAAPKEHSMTGCLAKGSAPDTYMRTDRHGRAPEGRGDGCQCSEGPALHENNCGQDDFANLPVVFRMSVIRTDWLQRYRGCTRLSRSGERV